MCVTLVSIFLHACETPTSTIEDGKESDLTMVIFDVIKRISGNKFGTLSNYSRVRHH